MWFPRPALFLSLLLAFGFQSGLAQKSACPSLPSTQPPAGDDIFSDPQEQWLGQAEADVIEPKLDLKPPPFADNYIDMVARRILAVLPPTELKYSFQMYESQELNSFGIAGGRIYLSSKMLAGIHNEDELAALLAHEIGHIATHQQAIDTTTLFRQAGITQAATDEAGMAAQFRKLLATPSLKGVSSKEETGQDIADRVAIYALTRAGYRASAFAQLFDRTTGNKGRKGNAVLDLLGYTGENTRRYRAAVAMAQAIPASCTFPTQPDESRFPTWQKHLAERDTEAAEETGQDAGALRLNSPLGADLSVIRFSPDGKLLLVLDAGTITIIDRAKLQVLFQVPAANMTEAWFTPDSAAVTFVTVTLRVEKWSIADHQRLFVYEPSFPEECLQIFLAPDGRSIACVTVGDNGSAATVGLTLLDTETSQVLWQNNAVAAIIQGMTSNAYTNLLVGLRDQSLFNFAQSTDGRILLMGALDRTLGFDLETRQPLSLQGELKHLGYSHYAFINNDKVLVENSAHPDKSMLVAYPGGEVLSHLKLGNQQLLEVSRGNAVILQPIKGAAVGLFDLDKMKLVASSENQAMTLYDTTLARQTPTGNLQLDDLANPNEKPKTVEIPRRRLHQVRQASISPDGRYFAISTYSRSGLWDLKSNTRLATLRPFDNSFFTPDGTVYLDLTKHLEAKRVVAEINLKTKQGKETTLLPEEDDLQAGDVLLHWKKIKDNNGTVEARRITDGQLAWSHNFPDSYSLMTANGRDPHVMFVWYLDSAGAKNELKQHPELKSHADVIADKRAGIVVEEYDIHNGTLLRAAVVEHKEASEKRYKYVARSYWTVGDYLIVKGDDSRSVVYHLPDGSEVCEFFGSLLDANAQQLWAATYDRSNEIRIMNLGNGHELTRRLFSSDVSFVGFRPGGNDLLVLTSDNVLHTIVVPGASK